MNRRNTIIVDYNGSLTTIRDIADLENKHYSTVYERYKGRTVKEK